MLKVAWRKSPSRRRREILLPASEPPQDARPMRSENRALLITSIARGRRWLNELVTEAYTNTESIATRERFSVRKVNMTISLAFLAPDLVKAAIEGRLPHGLGVVRLADLPAEWSRQRQMLGLPRIRTESPLTTVSGCRATEFRGPETEAPSRHSHHGSAVSETAGSYKTPPSAGLCDHPREISENRELRGGPGRTRTSNQTVMSGGTKSLPRDLTSSIVFVASRCDRFWCETDAVIAACLREASVA